MIWRVILSLTCLIVACNAEVAKPPKITTGFTKLIYFQGKADVKSLDCTAEGKPSPTYEWFKGDNKIVTDAATNVVVTGGRLDLTAPTHVNTGLYQCFAKNQYGTSMSSVVDIKKAEMDSFIELPIAHKEYNVGQHAILECRSKPSSTPAALNDWFSSTNTGTAVVTTNKIIIDQSGSLHFINVEKSNQLLDKDTYNCSFFNSVARTRVYGSPTNLTVKAITGPVAPRDPSIAYYTPDPDAVVLLGGMVTLQCIPDGYPIPTIEWSKEGGDLPFGRHEIFPNTYKLMIRNVTEMDEGMYRCTAVKGDKRNSQQIFVDVKSEPIWVEKMRSQTVTEGKTVQFNCVARSAIGETDNVMIEWFINTNPLKSGTNKITITGTRLTVSNVQKPYDLMNIQCKVSNTIGYQMADAFLNVIKNTVLTTPPKDNIAIDPGQIVEVFIAATADPLYSERLTYTWTKDGVPVSTDRKQSVYVNLAHTLVVNATKLDRDMDFLKVLGNYSCHVSLQMEDGLGDIITYTKISSDQEQEIIKEGALDLWWIAVIVAVVVLIIIIILICCLLYRNRGGTYPVDEKERRAGHDPEKELADSGFQDLSRADAPDEKKPYGNPDQVSLTNDPPLGGDTDSLDEYGEPDTSKFNEDGSFIGNYGGRKGRDTNQSTV